MTMNRLILLLLLTLSFQVFSQSDTNYPLLDDFTILTDTLNTTNSRDLFKGIIKVSDDLSGIDNYWIKINNPEGILLTIYQNSVSNDTIKYNLPQYSPEGVYSIERIYISDNVGNSHSYYSDELSTLGFKNSFFVSYSYVTNHLSIIPNDIPSSDLGNTSVSLSSMYYSDGYLGGDIYIYYGKGDTLTDFHNTNISIGEGVTVQDVTLSTQMINLDPNQVYVYKWVVKNNDGNIIFSSEQGTFTTNENVSPTDITLSSLTIDENLEVGTEVGTLTSTDEDTNDNHTYTLVSGTGDTDNGSFTITNDKLKSGVVFDFETKSSYSIRVQTDDGNGGTYSKLLTITVNDVNEDTDGDGVTDDIDTCPDTPTGDTVNSTGCSENQLSVDDEILYNSLKLYPNPVTNILTIESKNVEISKVEIYTVLGKKIKEITSNFGSITTDKLPKGIYIIRIYSEESSMIRKIIKI